MKNRVLLISIRYLAIILIIFTMILYNKTLINMFSVGIILLYIINNQVFIINLFGIITTLVSMGATVMAGDNMPQIIKSIGKFTPQYWVINSIDTGALFPNAMILILMAAAVFTAGSFRIRSFVNT